MPLFGSKEDRTERDLEETLLLISRLNIRDNRITSGIRRALVKKGVRALPALVRSLNSPDGMVREICVDILGEIASPQSTPPLLNRLYDHREDIPVKAVRALRNIVEKHLRNLESAKVVTDALTSERKHIVEPLVDALANPSELMRMGEVVRMLVDLKDEATRSLLRIYADAGYAAKEFIKLEILKIPESKKLDLIPFAGSFKNKDIQQLIVELLNSLVDWNNLRKMVETLLERDYCSLELKVFCRLKGITKMLIDDMGALKSEVRWRALSFLENFTAEEEVIRAIKKRLKDPEKRIRQRALLILGNIEDGFSFDPLLEAMDDADEDVHICALRMLVRRNYPEIITLLVKMSTRSQNLRAIALSELAQFSPHAYTKIMEQMTPPQREELRKRLEDFNLDIINTLRDELQNLDVSKRLQAARAIQVIGLPMDIDKDYVSSLADPDEKVRATLVKTIGVVGNTVALSAILRSLVDPDSRVRANAVETYAVMRDPALAKQLLPFLKDPDNRVRGNVIKVLLEMRYEIAFPALLDLLKSDKEVMRLSGLWVVEELREMRAKEIVAKLSLMDQSGTVRERALRVLETLGSSGGSGGGGGRRK